MIRLYDHLTVKPGSRDRGQLEELRRRAQTADRPLVVYPEGTRTRDGEINPFRTSGLKAVLTTRRWQVHIVVVDGVWKAGRFKDFVEHITEIRCVAESVGPFEFAPERNDVMEFISEMELRMKEKLAAMRRERNIVKPPADGREAS